MSRSSPFGFVEGLRWVAAGFRLIWRRPLLWLSLTSLLFAVALLASMLPSMGNLMLYTLSPSILGALMLVCHRLATPEAAPDLSAVTAALRASAAGLLALGLVYTGIQVGLLFLLATASPEVMQGLAPGKGLPATPGPDADALPMLLLVLALSVPATMLMWFSPALIVFRGMRVWPAMRYSLAACIFHWRACLANGVAVFLLLLLASLPAMLGLVVWVPLMIGTLYAAYAAIFGEPGRRDDTRVPDADPPHGDAGQSDNSVS